jgi:recombinational DNA repair ATPase RecF
MGAALWRGLHSLRKGLLMAYVRKTKDEYRILGNYGQGWEEVTAAPTYPEARGYLKDYRENDPQHGYKMTGPHRVKIEAAA